MYLTENLFQMKLIGFLVLFTICLSSSFGQIYQGVQELRPFEKDLRLLDGYLKSNPRKYQTLYSQLRSSNEKNEVKSLTAILSIYQGSANYYYNRIDSAIYYFDQAIEIADEIDQHQLYRTAKIRRIFCDDYLKSNYVLAQEMKTVFSDSYRERDTINMIYALNGMGLFYGNLDSISLTLKIYYGALELAEKSGNDYEKGFILNNLALVKYDLGAKDSALSDFEKCLTISKQTDNLLLSGMAELNMGLCYGSNDSVEMAKDQYLKVMDLGATHGYKILELSAMTNLASLETTLGHPERSDSLSNKALEIAKNELILFAVSAIYLGRSYQFMMNKEHDKALDALDSAEVYSEFASFGEVMVPYYHLQYRIHEERGDFEQALHYYQIKTEVKDSLNEIGNDKLLTEMQFKYEDEKKERIRMKEQNQLKLQLKQQEVDIAQSRQNLITLISIFILVFLVIVVLYFRLKQKSDNLFSFTITNKLEEERGRIARDLHDGLGQSMIVLKNKFNNIQLQNPSDANDLNDNFSEVIEEVRSISRSLIPPELKRLGLLKAILSMMNDIEKSSNFIVTTEIECLSDLNFEAHQDIRIYRIIQELCTNTIKHANASSLKLSASIEDNNLVIIYQDNGNGFDLEKWKAANNSVGFKSIEQRLKYLNGAAKVEKVKKGFKIGIKIPV